jgi:hypothetical protein
MLSASLSAAVFAFAEDDRTCSASTSVLIFESAEGEASIPREKTRNFLTVSAASVLGVGRGG